MSSAGQLTRPLRSRSGGQAVDRLQHGQPAQGHLHAPRRGGPGRVLVVCAVAAAVPCLFACGEGRVARPFQVGRVVVVQGEPLPVVLGQFPLGVEAGQAGGAGLLPGAGVLVVIHVQKVHGLAGEEETVLASFGHAPHDRLHPAAAAQPAQHGPDPILGGSQGGRQVGHAGQGHPGGDCQQSSLFVVQWLPGRHRYPSSTWTPPVAPQPVNPTCVEPCWAAWWALRRGQPSSPAALGKRYSIA